MEVGTKKHLFLSLFEDKLFRRFYSTTAGIGRMGPPEKIDLFTIDNFVESSIRTVKMYSILVDYGGNVVLKKHMHAAIHWVIKLIITFKGKVSKINDALSKTARLVHPSQLGHAWHADFKGRQTRVANACWPVASLGKIWQCFLCLPVDQCSGN